MMPPKTALLVEDEAPVRQFVTLALRQCGLTVLEAKSGAEAITICNGYAGPIPLLIADLLLPDAVGHGIASTLLALRPEMKVLYLSGYAEDFAISHGLVKPGTPFLQKPFCLADLVQKVNEMLDTLDPVIAAS